MKLCCWTGLHVCVEGDLLSTACFGCLLKTGKAFGLIGFPYGEFDGNMAPPKTMVQSGVIVSFPDGAQSHDEEDPNAEPETKGAEFSLHSASKLA